MVVALAEKVGEKPPAYTTVYRLIRAIDPALSTLAHEGTKVFSETYDLVHRTEATGPNVIWQADHCLLPIRVRDDKGKAQNPWLTIILDDYSRAVAGFFLTFNAPSAMQTALALRQAIWRKGVRGWQVCGIPDVLYTDHGCDFTSRHIEQVAVDLKMRLVFSGVGKPRGRGKIERFFSTLGQVFLSHLPGFDPGSATVKATLTLPELAAQLETFLIGTYHITAHSTTGIAPQERWHTGGFIPRMPESLEHLDLLLLTVPRTRRVQQDGIRFMGLRYIDPTLAAYVGEDVLLRYDPRDAAEVRVFVRDKFLCRAVCQELAGQTVPLRDIVSARDSRRRQLRQTLTDRRRVVESLLEVKRWTSPHPVSPPIEEPTPPPSGPVLKRYRNE